MSALYVHLPWCVRKCPYCDFNSHAVRGQMPEADYVAALARDLREQADVWSQPIESIFLGGGTPSLFAPESIAAILEEADKALPLAAAVEVTMEANPGTVETDRFAGFRSAGVNRLSLGVQSFDDGSLQSLGRIHDANQASQAIQIAQEAGFARINVDLMYGLPDQTLAMARRDVKLAIASGVEHISYYQLTLEPNTLFAARPPSLPQDDMVADIGEAGAELLRTAGFSQYEVSAWSQPGQACRHNLNYWRFGDYLGIGAGAHGKRSTSDQAVVRTTKLRQPNAYLRAPIQNAQREVRGDELRFEYFLNRLRLRQPVMFSEIETAIGATRDALQMPLRQAADKGLVNCSLEGFAVTSRGWLFLDDLVGLFLPDAVPLQPVRRAG